MIPNCTKLHIWSKVTTENYSTLEVTKKYFLIFQHEDTLNLCLNFNESQPIENSKRYTTKKSLLQSITFDTKFTFYSHVANLCNKSRGKLHPLADIIQSTHLTLVIYLYNP